MVNTNSNAPIIDATARDRKPMMRNSPHITSSHGKAIAKKIDSPVRDYLVRCQSLCKFSWVRDFAHTSINKEYPNIKSQGKGKIFTLNDSSDE